jgi:hypothetical protein
MGEHCAACGFAHDSAACSPQRTAARYVALFLQAQSYAGASASKQGDETHADCTRLRDREQSVQPPPDRQMYTWMSSSFPRPPAKRAVALAFMVGPPLISCTNPRIAHMIRTERPVSGRQHHWQCE